MRRRRVSTIEFDAPVDYQRVIYTPQRHVTIEASSKTGKTVHAFVWLFDLMCAGGPGRIYWWLAPSHKQAKMVFERACRWLAPYIKAGVISKLQTPLRLTLETTDASGSFIEFFTSKSEDIIYGDEPAGVVVDEASRHRTASCHALMTTLVPAQAPSRWIGNVKNRVNFHWAQSRIVEADMGRAGGDRNQRLWGYAKWTIWDAVRAGLHDRDEIMALRQTYVEQGALAIWMRDFEAELGDGGEAFTGSVLLAADVAPKVPDGSTFVLLDTSGNGDNSHPFAFVAVRMRRDGDDYEGEVFDSVRWRGRASDFRHFVFERCDALQPDAICLDQHDPLLVADLQDRYGEHRVFDQIGRKNRMWAWYTTVRNLMAAERLRLDKQAHVELIEDLEHVALGDDCLVFVVYSVEEWDDSRGELVNRSSHCDLADALIRMVQAIPSVLGRAEPVDTLARNASNERVDDVVDDYMPSYL